MGKVQRLANQERTAGAVLAGQGHAQTGAEAVYALPGVFVKPGLPRTNSSPWPWTLQGQDEATRSLSFLHSCGLQDPLGCSPKSMGGIWCNKTKQITFVSGGAWS